MIFSPTLQTSSIQNNGSDFAVSSVWSFLVEAVTPDILFMLQEGESWESLVHVRSKGSER